MSEKRFLLTFVVNFRIEFRLSQNRKDGGEHADSESGKSDRNHCRIPQEL